MLSLDALLPIARHLEDGLQPQLKRHDAALAHLRERPDADHLGPMLDELAGWADVAPIVADVLAGPDGATEAVEDETRIRSVGAAHVRPNAVRFVQLISSPDRGVDRIAHPCSQYLVQGAHRICHPEGLDSVDHGEASVKFQSGSWRRWSIDDTAPAPHMLASLMSAWERVFSSSMWDRRHPVVQAALAAITLSQLRPFPTGNAAVAQLVALGVLRRDGAPISPTFLAADALEAVGPDLCAVSADELMDRCARFASILAAQLEAAPRHLNRLQGIGDEFGQAIPAFQARYTLNRAELARGVGARPLDMPPSIAWRYCLTQDATVRILRRLVASGHLHLRRVNGRQVVLSPTAIVLLRDLRSAADDVSGGNGALPNRSDLGRRKRPAA